MVKYKKIFSRKVFLQLVVKGHELLWTEPNKSKPWLSVFVMKEDESFLNDLSKITRK